MVAPKAKQVLILGVGNLLLSDEGVGVHAVRALERSYRFPPEVTLLDGGTGALSLLPEIQNSDQVFILDALLLDEPPGTVAHFTYQSLPPTYQRKDAAHGIDILDVLAAASFQDRLPPVTILGIQPGDMTTPGLELTPAVASSLDTLIKTLVAELKKLGICVEPKGGSERSDPDEAQGEQENEEVD